MRIKTIQEKDPKAFDIEVNAAIKDGWTLANRGVITTDRVWAFYAELIQPDAEDLRGPVPIDPFDAAETVARECSRYSSCEECMIQSICNFNPPNAWQVNGMEAQA